MDSPGQSPTGGQHLRPAIRDAQILNVEPWHKCRSATLASCHPPGDEGQAELSDLCERSDWADLVLRGRANPDGDPAPCDGSEGMGIWVLGTLRPDGRTPSTPNSTVNFVDPRPLTLSTLVLLHHSRNTSPMPKEGDHASVGSNFRRDTRSGMAARCR
jgi:hypothetical protein